MILHLSLPKDQLVIGGVKVNTYNESSVYSLFREFFQVPDDFLASTSAFDWESMSPGGGKGGSLMAFSSDFKYLVKELNGGDHESLLQIALPYRDHVLGDHIDASAIDNAVNRAITGSVECRTDSLGQPLAVPAKKASKPLSSGAGGAGVSGGAAGTAGAAGAGGAGGAKPGGKKISKRESLGMKQGTLHRGMQRVQSLLTRVYIHFQHPTTGKVLY
jgi:hypothetical protein